MLPEHAFTFDNHAGPEVFVPLWFRISTLFLLGIAFALLSIALGDHLYSSNLAAAALVAVFIALGCATVLHIRAWNGGRRDLFNKEQEFSCVYQNALDAILILDNRGVCLDANPAAFALLGTPAAEMLGRPFSRFYLDLQQFERQWRNFLARGTQRGNLRLFRPDGAEISVRYTASANHLPGRHMMILCDITERVEAEDKSRATEERLRQVTENIHEIVWMMDAATKRVIHINRAYETITGRSLDSIENDPRSYADLIHPADREHVFAKLEEATRSGHFDEEFRIVRPDTKIRWVGVKGSAIPRRGAIRQLVGTAQDITARKTAAAQVAEHLAQAEIARNQADGARREAEALRRATIAITQDLRMDVVLDAFLRSVFEIIPFDTASVILIESDGRLFVAREAPLPSGPRKLVTLDLKDHAFLQPLILLKKSAHIEDTHEERDWPNLKPFGDVRSWLGVPLVMSGTVLGLLSIGCTEPGVLTLDHFRMAKSLAIPAAAAIHNARLYEWAQIYAKERKTLLEKVDAAKSGWGEARPH
jgi:PAS domain S-box-containing protein